MTTPASSMLLVLLASVLGSFASVLLKAGANHLHRDRDRLQRAALRLGGGVALFGSSSVVYAAAVTKGSLTVLYPIVSMSYVWTLLWGRLFFHEKINRLKVCGVTLILAGVFSIASGA